MNEVDIIWTQKESEDYFGCPIKEIEKEVYGELESLRRECEDLVREYKATEEKEQKRVDFRVPEKNNSGCPRGVASKIQGHKWVEVGCIPIITD